MGPMRGGLGNMPTLPDYSSHFLQCQEKNTHGTITSDRQEVPLQFLLDFGPKLQKRQLKGELLTSSAGKESACNAGDPALIPEL